MGGQIGLESTPGVGSTFWFQVRLDRSDAEAAPLPTPPADLVGSRVLIVDDNATNRNILERQLAGWGMLPESVADGASALMTLRSAAVLKKPFALALLDLQMPVMNGLDLARQIKIDALLSYLPLVMLTSVGLHGGEAAFRQSGIAVALSKPVRQPQLLEALGVAMQSRAARNVGIRRVAQAVEMPALLRRSTPRPRVLIAEDNAVNQRVAVRMLERLGYWADVASDGREAVQSYVRQPYAAILMDCQMPDMDGFEATMQIREREGSGRRTPIIAMTASAMQGDRERCLAAGMDDYLSKPVQVETLRTVLERWAPATGEQRDIDPRRTSA
jgi:CheY-like chemotaxis protein